MCLVIRIFLKELERELEDLDHYSFSYGLPCRAPSLEDIGRADLISRHPDRKSRPWPVYLAVHMCIMSASCPSMASEGAYRSGFPRGILSRPRRKVTEPDPPPPVPYEDSIFSVQTDVSRETTCNKSPTAMLDRIDRYT